MLSLTFFLALLIDGLSLIPELENCSIIINLVAVGVEAFLCIVILSPSLGTSIINSICTNKELLRNITDIISMCGAIEFILAHSLINVFVNGYTDKETRMQHCSFGLLLW